MRGRSPGAGQAPWSRCPYLLPLGCLCGRPGRPALDRGLRAADRFADQGPAGDVSARDGPAPGSKLARPHQHFTPRLGVRAGDHCPLHLQPVPRMGRLDGRHGGLQFWLHHDVDGVAISITATPPHHAASPRTWHLQPGLCITSRRPSTAELASLLRETLGPPSTVRRGGHLSSWRAMTSRWTWLVPS